MRAYSFWATALFAPFFAEAQVKPASYPIYINAQQQRQEVFPSGQKQVAFLEKMTVGERYELSLPAPEDFGGCPPEVSSADPAFSIEKDPAGWSWQFVAQAERAELLIEYCPKSVLKKGHWVSIQPFSPKKKKGGLAEMLAVLQVQGGFTASQLAKDVLIGGDCFDVTNVTSFGQAVQFGKFTQGMSSLGFDEGVILATGNRTVAPGPNDDDNAGTLTGGATPDADLTALGNGGTIYNKCVLEFDFKPTLNPISFDYVFASEEYCEYVGSQFNDRFGFFLSGPGISGGFSGGSINIALVPSTTTYVGINSVNHQTNTAYFVNNDNFDNPPPPSEDCSTPLAPFAPNDIQYDGFTTVLTANLPVLQLCSTYHIKLKVADVGDGAFDSAVFLKGGSFGTGAKSGATTTVNGSAGDTVTEGCDQGAFVFEVIGDPGGDFTVTYTISGTATSGTDYDPIPTSVIIPSGSTTFTLPVNVINDGITEPVETIILTLTQACSCEERTCTLKIKDPVIMTVALPPATICEGNSTTLTPSVSGGLAPYTYVWSTGDTDPSITVSPTVNTTYSVTVTDDCGQTKVQTTQVTVNPEPEASISGSVVACTPNAVPFSIPLTYSGSLPFTLTYSVDGSPVTVTVTSMPYNLTGTATTSVSLTSVTSGGCPGDVSGTFTIDHAPITATATPTNVPCNGGNNGSITVTSTGVPTFSFAWTPSGLGNTDNPQNLGPGTYTVTVTDGNNCTATATANIAQPPVMTLSVGNISPATCDDPTGGEATATAGGGSPGFTYEWSDGTNGPTITAGPGTYTVTATDANGCTKTATATIPSDMVPPNAVANAPTPLSCTNTEVTINGNGSSTGSNFTYQWTANPGNIVSGDQTLTPVVNEAGTYTILVSNSSNGCTAAASVTVAANQAPPVAVATTPGSITCTTPTLVISGNGSTTGTGITYQWTANPGNITSGGTTLNPTINQGGTYTILVTNGTNGCTAEASVTIDQDNTPPEAVIPPPPAIDCNNATVTIDAGGSTYIPPATFAWSPAGGIVSGGTTLTPIVNAPGTYTLTITQTNGCTDVASVTVSQNTTLPTAVANAPTPISCANPEVSINGNGSSTGSNFTYQWTASPGNITGGDQTLNPTVDQPGTYTILVTNTATGCTKTATVTVGGGISYPTAVANTPVPITCTTTTVTISGAGSSTGSNFTYQWTAAPGNIVSGGTTLNPVVNQGGSYTLVVTNTTNQCTAEVTVTVDQDNTPPVAVIAPPQELNCSFSSIQIDASGSTVQPPATYAWSPTTGILSGGNSLTPVVNAPGTYTLTITQANGCTDVASVTITQNLTPPLANATAVGQISCTTPEVPLLGTGSSTGPNISYTWSTNNGVINGPTDEINTFAGQPGTYTLVVTNNDNGCTAVDQVVVTGAIDFPVAVANVPAGLNCTTTTVTISGNGSSTGPTFNYQWSANPGNIVSGSTTLNPVVNQGGSYTLVVTNSATNCSATITVDVNQDIVEPQVVIAPPQQLNCSYLTVEIDAGGSFYSPPASFTWTTSGGGNILSGQNTLNPTVNQPGTYTLLITNQSNGCTDVASVVVTQNTVNPTAIAATAGTVSCTTPTVPLLGNGSSTGVNFTYQWTTPNGSISCSDTDLNSCADAPGTYTLLVVNEANGCTATAQVTVTGGINTPNAEANVNGMITCAVSTLSLSGAGSSVGPNFTYQWTASPGSFVSGQGSLSPIVNAAGVYTLLVTNTTNGCTNTATVEVFENKVPPVVVIYPPLQLDCNNAVVGLDASGSSAIGQASYQWTAAPGHIVSGANTLGPIVDQPGTYTLKITDTENGCTDIGSITVVQDLTPPNAFAGPDVVLTCPAPTTVLGGNSSAGPQFTYLWTTSNGNITTDPEQAIIEVDAPGTYLLTIVNTENGCTADDVAVVTSNIVLPPVQAGPSFTIDCNTASLNLNGAGSATGSSFTYEWWTFGGNIVSGATTLTPNINAPGVYVLQVTNNLNGCTAVDDTEVFDDQVPPVAAAGGGSLITCTQPTTILSGTGSSTGGLFTYLWQTVDGHIVSGATTLQPVVDEAGTYILTVKNTSNGCTASAQVVVNQDNSVPVAAAQPPGILDCATQILTINASASSQGAGYSFTWNTADGHFSANQNTLTPTVDEPGTYVLTITNLSNQCTATATVLIEENTTPPPVDAGLPKVLTCLIKEVEIGYFAPPSDPNFTYQWTAAPGNFVSGQTGTNPVVNAPGTYNLLVTNDLNHCTATASVVISQNTTAPTAVAAPGGTLTCTVLSLNLSGAGSSTGSGFLYQWTTANGNLTAGQTTLAPTVDKPGQYLLTITDTQNGCTSTASTSVLLDAVLPDAVAAAPGILTCEKTTLTLSGSGSTTGQGIDYQWVAPSGGNILSGANGLSPVVDKPGEYVLTVKNMATGCTETATVFVNQDIQPPLADAGAQATINCLSPQMVLDGSGSSTGSEFTYLWTTANGNITSGATSLSPIIDLPGQYVLTVKNNANGCTSTATVNILKDVNAPTAAILTPSILDCDSPTALLDASGSTSGANILITWTEAVPGAFVSGAGSLKPICDQPGQYILNITNLDNGCYDEEKVTVLQDIAPPPADAGLAATLNCTATTLTLGSSQNPTGSNYSFAWNTVGGHIISGSNTSSPIIDKPGLYKILVTNNSNGCTAVDSVAIDQNIVLPTAWAGPTFELNCITKTFVLKATATQGPTIAYEWATQGGHFTGSNLILQPEVDAAGAYSLLVTDLENGCTATSSVIITQSADVPVAAAGLPVELTCAITTAALNGSGSTTGPTISYQWTTLDGEILLGATSLTPTIGTPGTYVLEVLNSVNSCKSVSQVIVSENLTPPVAEAGPEATLTCQNTSLTLTGSGSSPLGGGVSFSWTGVSIVSGANTPSPVVSQPGQYNLLITSQLNGCTATDAVQVLADVNLPVAAIATPVVLTCLVKNATLDASGGTTTGSSITYVWSTNDGNFISQNGLKAVVDEVGSYQLLVTNSATGCSATANVSVIEDTAPPAVEAGPAQTITCTVPSLSLNGTGSAYGPNFTYLWTTSGTGKIVSGEKTLFPVVSAPGSYTLLVTNTTTGCTATDQVLISPDLSFPVAAIAQPGVLTCAVKVLTLNAGGSSQGPDYPFVWSTAGGNFVQGQNTLAPVIDQPGVYNLLVTNALNGCTLTASVTVLENTALPTVDAGPGFELNCTVEDGALKATVSPANVLLNWTTVGGNFLSGTPTLSPKVNEPGSYQLLVTRTDNGCTASDLVIVTEETNVPTGIDIDLTYPRCDGDVGKILFTKITGGIEPMEYSIDGGTHFFTEKEFPGIEPGSYELMIVDAKGCTLTEHLDVPAPLEPTADLPAEIKIELGDSTRLNVDIGSFPIALIDSVEWKPLTGLTFKSNKVIDRLRPWAKPLENTVYKVKITSVAGCTAEAKVQLRVSKDYHIYIPNVISPWNKDGLNDIFLIFGDPKQVVEISAFEVFDRWGDKVWSNYGFKPNDPVEGWNAVMRDKYLNPAVFVYWARVKFIDGKEVIYKGDVTIVR